MVRSLIPMLLLSSLGACVADNGDEGIFITKNVAPGEDCSFSASESSPFLAHGTFSIFSPAAYRVYPQLQSRVTATTGQEDARTIIVRGARVELEFADTTLFSASELAEMRTAGLTRFETLFTAPLRPNGGIADGAVDVVQPAVLDRIVAKRPDITAANAPVFRTEVIGKIRVFGDMSGSEITSQEFQFPLTICNNCVINVIGACPLPMGTMVRPGNSCNPYQDGVVDCCMSDGQLSCPATVSTTTP